MTPAGLPLRRGGAKGTGEGTGAAGAKQSRGARAIRELGERCSGAGGTTRGCPETGPERVCVPADGTQRRGGVPQTGVTSGLHSTQLFDMAFTNSLNLRRPSRSKSYAAISSAMISGVTAWTPALWAANSSSWASMRPLRERLMRTKASRIDSLLWITNLRRASWTRFVCPGAIVGSSGLGGMAWGCGRAGGRSCDSRWTCS
mmetsp:Transcript_83355/g.139296  ORF Transcript_83355/g.139296 Transcript_83355/m.139296 type:complete len:202 (-) Transcript_83355:753-1358(-)